MNANGRPFDGSADSKPLRKVELSAFSIGKYPVTHAEYDVFTAALRPPRINQGDAQQKYRIPADRPRVWFMYFAVMRAVKPPR